MAKKEKPEFMKDLLQEVDEDEEEKEREKIENPKDEKDEEEFVPELVVNKEIKDHIFDVLNSAVGDAKRITEKFENLNTLFAKLHNPLETRTFANFRLELVKYRSVLIKIRAKLKTIEYQCTKDERYDKIKESIKIVLASLENLPNIPKELNTLDGISQAEETLITVLEYSLSMEAELTTISEEIKRFG